MPVFIIALILLVAIFGFWDTLGAIVGGVAILIILALLIGAVALFSGYRIVAGRRRDTLP